jgi:hypothetical protein
VRHLVKLNLPLVAQINNAQILLPLPQVPTKLNGSNTTTVLRLSPNTVRGFVFALFESVLFF